ncbi:Intron-binding protein aquarius [Ceratocystis fimbriata CBS 114723]|uniref:Pre-mRNA-splicing factor n=1 Tax=Ceratocystis fimbriata CBS 114723 TaxID=1035309 RepID=A0A2C5XCJ2_9PEZI|nr:Intron-binding protein aquarius [Ceratocystis fimbriata CBS 114723]
MPKAKRLKSDTSQSLVSSEPSAGAVTAMTDSVEATSSVATEANNEWLALAQNNWLGTKGSVKIKNDLLKEIWETLEKDGFRYHQLLSLEGVQTLENYLWPGFSDDSTNTHVLLIVLLLNVKRRENLDSWTLLESRLPEFSQLFRRIISMFLDNSLASDIRTHLLCFIIQAFQSLDYAPVRKECAPLVSISIWHNLSSDSFRESKLDQVPHLRKAWRASAKRFDAADDATKTRLRFERAWLYTITLDFLRRLYNESSKPEDVLYCERFIEFLCDLQSQLPTRRYVNTLIHDLQIVPVMRLSPMFCAEDNSLLRDMHTLLSHYTYFSIDDQTGLQYSRDDAYEKHCAVLSRLQRTALKHFESKLMVLALSNYGSIDKRRDLEPLLSELSDEELVELATLLDIRSSYPGSVGLDIDRKLIMEILLSFHERKKSFKDVAEDLALVPTEQALFESNLLRTESYDGTRPMALPKLNLQYLSVGDFLWRSLILYRCEAFYGIRSDIETALRRLMPEASKNGDVRFTGSTKMAVQISKPTILEVAPAAIGDNKPSIVKAEISFDIRRMDDRTRREWDSLRVDDVVFLLAVTPSSLSRPGAKKAEDASPADSVTAVRTAEILSVVDEKGRNLRDFNGKGRGQFGSQRKVTLKLDTHTYKADSERAEKGKGDVYAGINVLLRRHSRENNFKSILETIQTLALSDVPLAPWLHEVFLGYGDPAAASYKHLPNRIHKVDFRDTFLDWSHLIESLPGKTVQPAASESSSFGPPYVLETEQPKPQIEPTAATGKSVAKKRRRDVEPAMKADIEALKVSSYKELSMGPYPSDVPKKNAIRFTPAQVEAITSGTQPGLTVIVGPPGTGKTDVITQIISNIYHNFPKQKTLLITHGNQALNQLFAKIAALNIDNRHLLRLGHGEDELEMDANFSKYGRVESFLQNRDGYLLEVSKLAACLGAPGAHGNSAETAGYFNMVYVQPAWAKFRAVCNNSETSATDIAAAFPFHNFFADAPQPLFAPEAARDTVVETAEACYRHIERVFSELADILPFEILRRDKEKANYLLTNEARIVAMTSTHAAMRRQEIAALGFKYDNVVFEEAAQITEIETFIPFALQKPMAASNSGAATSAEATPQSSMLQRIVLCGDHLQNSPIIQNMAFRTYANLEQSLFSRLVRLDVPTITLDQQGRARPSIADLYRWRYQQLLDLPLVQTSREFLTANAGFRYDFQFIDVPDYKGKGEAEPTPHFVQNLGEAEYAVAIYQYMRLLGYPASKISILTTYAGQRALIRDVLQHRCARNRIFGMPRAVATVDKYQGEQNDYVIVSLTRTRRVGYLRDLRRLTVGLSRARLGLYVLGRRAVFESCVELRPALSRFFAGGRPDKLTLVTGELWPSQRLVADEAVGVSVPGEFTSEGVEHLGLYVYEMTQTKMKELEGEDGVAAEAKPEDATVLEAGNGEQEET